jgi:hypothetical protein
LAVTLESGFCVTVSTCAILLVLFLNRLQVLSSTNGRNERKGGSIFGILAERSCERWIGTRHYLEILGVGETDTQCASCTQTRILRRRPRSQFSGHCVIHSKGMFPGSHTISRITPHGEFLEEIL